jgi:hydrogenase-4 component F
MEYILGYIGVNILLMAAFYFTKNRLGNYLIFIPFIANQVFFNVMVYQNLDATFSEYFRFDTMGLIFITVLSIISIPAVVHTIIYNENRTSSIHQNQVHHAALVLFIMAMTGTLISNHYGMLWSFLEATTVASALLIYFDRSNVSLEAAWKYFFVSSIGLALAYLGIIFLGIAGQSSGHYDLAIDTLPSKIGDMSPLWLKISFIFILAGFSVKMGAAPLFTVDIDAKDSAPSPVGALFSGGLMNVGFISIYRFYEVFSQTSILDWMNQVMVITGCASVFFSAVYLLKVKNLKRILAYSSVEHGGLVLIAFGCGTHLGYIAGIAHLIFHSFAKAALFFQVGQIYRTFQDKNVVLYGKYLQIYPQGAFVLIIGFISIMALPPSGLFLSEFFIFGALFQNYHWLTGVLVIFLLCFVFFALIKNLLDILFQPLPPLQEVHEKIKPWESISQYILLAFVIYMGLNPSSGLIDWISRAIIHLPM